ncbi:unnamed protein product [Paramecium sonneborni]|uniref:EGF-like domain-containing protein n=1 Tax=Paramecium sonneborni TaxID=65129 RepID=A0A8S1NE25_9CILI|nr:unnamed protein product [Paramecium sonneborni]
MYFLVFLILIQKIITQWLVKDQAMISNVIYEQVTAGNAFEKTEGFVKTSNTLMTANFINCQTPLTSYITLDKNNPGIENYKDKQVSYGSVLSFDLYFHGTWNAQSITINLGSFSHSISYIQPSTYHLDTQFCDNTPYEIQSHYIFFQQSYSGKFSYSSSNLLDGKVSLRNIFITRLQCYPSCMQCSGPEFNECSMCFYGIPLNNICPTCPNGQYYVKYLGCRNVCNFDSKLFKNQFCEGYPITYFLQSKLDLHPQQIEQVRWSINYDKKNIDPTIRLDFHVNNILCFGIFKYNSGIQRFVNEINPNIGTQLIGLRIEIILFNSLTTNSGINIQINNTYYGSLYKISTQIETHNMFVFDQTFMGCSLPYTNCYLYELHMFVDIPSNPFLFSIFGNFTDNNAGWGLVSFAVTSGYCPDNCLECEISFQCKTCMQNFKKYRDGRCNIHCNLAFQRSNDTHCIDFDDETSYSKYLIQEYIDFANDPTQEYKYILISQSPLNGKNFLKGDNIMYSYWKTYRIFGGPYVWAQAKFQREHQILNPHHSITIGFEVLFGPTFPLTGSFIYTIQSNPSVNLNLQTTGIYANDDGTKTKRVYEKINHNSGTLIIYWECYGSDNEPVSSYCGFFNYYIAVHYCQPFCTQCTNENTCTQWNSTYYSNIVKFSQSECFNNQYHDKNQWTCLNCPNQCMTCTSLIDCQICQNTYTLTKQGCVCKQNQYEDSIQCYDCPVLCKQCLSATYCIECFLSDFRELVQGECTCMEGYYEVIGSTICLQCHQFCKECSGSTNNNCYSCSDIVGIDKQGNTCQCPLTTFYSEQSNSCMSCHNTCLTCFNESINGCLTCDISLNRNLIGLNCQCSSGYYEDSGTCESCPDNEDSSFTQCYVLCLNNQMIWHKPGCTSCDDGFILVNKGCQPFCGDQKLVGNEQCDDGNNELDDKCFNCRFQCPKNCLDCNQYTSLPCPDLCGDGIVTGLEECEDGNIIQFDGCYNCKYQCQESCTKCLKGVCYECAGGWYIDPLIWRCKERCGDRLVVGQEQCDDANQADHDGCKECRYFCRNGCSSCNFDTNICLACQYPGFVPNQYYCQNVCGDGLVVSDPFFIEVCDDIGCKSDCKSCKQGYVLVNSICEPICGDSLVVEKEMCEDIFTLPYRCQHCQTKCQLSCLLCDTTGKGCLICNIGYENIDNLCYSICGDQIVTNDEDCDDGNLIIGDGCHFCQYSCLHSCQDCIKGKCLNCMDGYSLILSTCQLDCDDGITIWEEQCDYIILTNNDGCYKCLQCSDYCQDCQNGICISCQTNYELDILYHTCKPIHTTNKNIEPYCVQFKENQCLEQREALMNFLQYSDFLMNTCFEHCKNCLLNKCIECQQGYYGSICLPKCGDNIVVLEEECDCIRGKMISECFNCKLICPNFCQLCVFGQCQQCQYGFYLDVLSNTCQSICGDNIQSLNELCDDGNDQDYDGCSSCQYQCELECLDCQFGKCTLCFEPFLLVQSKVKCEPIQSCEAQFGYYYESFTNSCISLCGDGIVSGDEDCDDINDTPYDGCYQCKFQCSKLCELCDNGICLIEACPLGTIPMKNSCCGDFIVNGDEECDDGNLIDFDGCSQCFFQCDQFCNTCDQGNCIQCIEGFTLDKNKCFLNEYQQIQYLETEKKQQSNSLNFDQICRNDECVYSLRPQMKLTFLNQTFSKQYVEISFDQEVQLDGSHIIDQLQIFEILIENLDDQFYNLQLQSIVSITSDLQYVQYIIEIDIQLEIQEKPTLSVSLMKTVINSNNQTVFKPSQAIHLNLPKIMSEKIKQQAITISSTNKAFMITAISISVISLLFGEASLFIETLSTLQYQSYLKFINLDYPENLYMYFQTSEMLSLSSYLDNLQIDYLLGIITRKPESQIKIDGKFAFYNVDCDLISNLVPQFFQLVIILTIVLNSKKLYILYQNFFSTMLSNYILQNTQSSTQYLLHFILNVGKQFKKFLKFRYQLTLIQILPLFSLNAWDLLFKILLQIHFNDLSNARYKFQYICGLSILTSYLIILLKSYNSSIPKQEINDVYYRQNRYLITDIVRTFQFHIVLVFFQNDPITQTFLIAINSILQCIFIFKYQQVNRLDKFTNISNEAAVALFSLTTYIYYKENLYSYQTILQAGFFHMGILMISLSLVFLKQIWRKTQKIISQLVKRQKKEKPINHEIFL